MQKLKNKSNNNRHKNGEKKRNGTDFQKKKNSMPAVKIPSNLLPYALTKNLKKSNYKERSS